MKKYLLIILTVSYFSVAQAGQTTVSYRTNDVREFWIPAATVLTVAGLIHLNSHNDRDRYDDGVKVTVDLINKTDDLDKLREIRRDRSRYFTKEVDRYYNEKRDRIYYIDSHHDNGKHKGNYKRKRK